MLVTFNEELEPLPVSVRVGQAVDVVGQAGKPKTITGIKNSFDLDAQQLIGLKLTNNRLLSTQAFRHTPRQCCLLTVNAPN